MESKCRKVENVESSFLLTFESCQEELQIKGYSFGKSSSVVHQSSETSIHLKAEF